MYKNMNELITDDIDLESLDRGAQSNAMLKDKQYSMMCNIMQKASNFYSFVTNDKANAIAARLQGKGIGCYELNLAIDKVIDNYDRFPSFKAIYELCNSYRKSPLSNDDDREKKQIEEEDKKVAEIEANFIKAFGSEERLAQYVKWWLKQHYDLDSDLLEAMSLSVELFKKPALFDWFDSGYTKHITRVTDVFNKKKAKLDKINANPHRAKTYLRL